MPNWKGEILLLHFSIGYFVADLIIMAYLGIMDSLDSYNHIACIIGMLVVLMTGTGGNYAVMGMFIITVPKLLMKFRAILRHLGMRYTLLHEVS